MTGAGRRAFNDTERVALYMLAEGHCTSCGAALSPSWHADHVQPWSKGGATAIENGQALCARCNQVKGATMTVSTTSGASLPKWTFPLRAWQEKAYKQYFNTNAADFLAVATPGAGKTTFALRIGHTLLRTGEVDIIVIVCPTDHLRQQWAAASHGKTVNGVFYPFGLNITSEWTSTSGDIPSDCHGIAITYHQVASPLGSEVIRWLMSKRRVFVVFDEVHHAGEDMTWGDSLWQVFGQASRRLSISGTPFRADNNRIPFVKYDDNHRSVSDYAYTYADALRDRICRPVIFPSFEGEMEWFSHTGDYKKAIFQEVLNEQQASERLNTALSPSGNWLPQVLKEAHDTLMRLRGNGDAQAGGLVITKDTEHAVAVAQKLYELTGIMPEIATSKDPKASKVISDYAKSTKPWIVAIRMISEGVDIPRLRVLVYATNITTELFFRQAVGRIVRVRPELEDNTAYFYVPSDRRYLSYAQAIKEEIDHVIKEVTTVERPPREPGGKDIQTSLFMPIAATAARGNTVFDAGMITPEELDEARRMLESMGGAMMGIAVELFAEMLKRIRSEQGAPPPVPQEPETEAYTQRLKHLKDAVNTLVNRYSYLASIPQKDLHVMWMRQYKGSRQSEASEEELVAKKAWITELLEDWNRHDR